MPYLLCCIIILGVLICRSGHAAIYRCIDEHGHHTYTDRPCQGREQYTPQAHPGVTFTPMDAADQKRLQQAQQRDRQQRQAQRRARITQYREQVAQLAERRALCGAAISDLQKLKDRRRKGYALQAQRQLDARETALKLSKRQNC